MVEPRKPTASQAPAGVTWSAFTWHPSLALFDLGIGAAVVRYVARFEGLTDRKAVNRVFSTSIAIFAVAGALALAIASGLADRPFSTSTWESTRIGATP